MKGNPVTLKDIANELGVSMGTVSRALKDYPGISDKTKKAVKDLAKKLKYRPNPVALNLKRQRSKIIGVVCPKIFHTFFSSVINGIMKAADKEGYTVILVQTDESYKKEVKEAKVLLQSPLEGLLISTTFETQHYTHLEQFLDYGIPVVQYDRINDDLDTSKIHVDDYDGAFQATQHLIDQGCKHIALVRGKLIPLIKRRLEGFQDALKANGLSYSDEMVLETKTSEIEEGVELTDDLLKLSQRPDGVLSFADVTALGLMKGLKARGIRIPEDIAIVGFNDSDMSTLVEPSLTAVAQPGYKMGKTAANILFREIEVVKNDDDPIPEEVTLKTELVIRESSKKN